MIDTTRPRPRFAIGQLIRHRRYGYRGVVVHVDPFCRAPEDWYFANRTQPDREQAWYHVLVDGGERITYAAQDSLMSNDVAEPVENPLVKFFFSDFNNGSYIRNERTWDGSW